VIPRALFDYYSVAGGHWINEHHDHLRSIEELEWMDDKLVFLDENQRVVYWGIDRPDLKTADPIVWQGVNGESVVAQDHGMAAATSNHSRISAKQAVVADRLVLNRLMAFIQSSWPTTGPGLLRKINLSRNTRAARVNKGYQGTRARTGRPC
jgi:hypothetical protein